MLPPVRAGSQSSGRVTIARINNSGWQAEVDAFRLGPIAALLQVLPWAALTSAVLWRMIVLRSSRSLGYRWILVLLLLWLTASAVFLVLQDVLGASGYNENLLILGGVLAGYGVADLCVRVLWERAGR
jgi:hypothetical protein